MRLRELQRWMASTIMRPLTADFRMPTDGNDKLLGVIDSLIAPSPKLSSLQRLEIYNRQYWFRLLDSLREDFPALVRLVGDTVFRGLAEDYLQRNPSHSFTLRDLGSRLSSWLQGLADQKLRESESWHAGLRYPLQLLADVAALEWAYIEAFDSAEVPSLGAEDFGNGKIDLRLQPFVRPVALAFNISSFVVAVHNGEEDPPTISQQPQTELCSRIPPEFSAGSGAGSCIRIPDAGSAPSRRLPGERGRAGAKHPRTRPSRGYRGNPELFHPLDQPGLVLQRSPCEVTMSFAKLYDRYSAFFGRAQSLLLLAVRLYWGWQFAQTGWGKLTHISRYDRILREHWRPRSARQRIPDRRA